MGINGANFNPFNMMDYSNIQTNTSGYSSDFNVFNPIEQPSSMGKVSEVTGDAFSSELKSQADEVVKLTEKIEAELNKRHPEGFRLVGIGRSPSVIIELMREKGYDAKTCALSGLMTGEFDISGKYSYLRQLDTMDVRAYAEYLDGLGISADKIKTSAKPYVFVDYTRTGESLRSFAQLLARNEIGIKENVEFLSLNNDLLPNQTMAEKGLINSLWENLGIKNFSFAPRVEVSELGQAKRIVQNFKPTERAVAFLAEAVKLIKMVK